VSVSVNKLQNSVAVDPDRPTPAPRFLPLETISVRFSLTPGSDTGQRRPAFGVVSNMSVTGCCIITNRAVVIGAIAVLEFRNARRRDILRLPARIVWCAERLEPVKEIVGYLTGVSFNAEDSGPIADLLMSGLFQPIP
jgi:PilZ domain